VAEETGFDEALRDHDLLITGEGMLDDTSFDGKVVGSAVAWARDVGLPAMCVVGDIDPAMNESLAREWDVHSLTAAFGRNEAMARPMKCIEELVRGLLQARQQRR
jgi:glycerate kinase